MGWNTTVVVMNDALHIIEEDQEFGKKLVNAIHAQWRDRREPVDVSAKRGNTCYSNAATVIEQHHADENVIVCVGGNYGEVIMSMYGNSDQNTKDRIYELLHEEKKKEQEKNRRKEREKNAVNSR